MRIGPQQRPHPSKVFAFPPRQAGFPIEAIDRPGIARRDEQPAVTIDRRRRGISFAQAVLADGFGGLPRIAPAPEPIPGSRSQGDHHAQVRRIEHAVVGEGQRFVRHLQNRLALDRLPFRPGGYHFAKPDHLAGLSGNTGDRRFRFCSWLSQADVQPRSLGYGAAFKHPIGGSRVEIARLGRPQELPLTLAHIETDQIARRDGLRDSTLGDLAQSRIQTPGIDRHRKRRPPCQHHPVPKQRDALALARQHKQLVGWPAGRFSRCARRTWHVTHRPGSRVVLPPGRLTRSQLPGKHRLFVAPEHQVIRHDDMIGSHRPRSPRTNPRPFRERKRFGPKGRPDGCPHIGRSRAQARPVGCFPQRAAARVQQSRQRSVGAIGRLRLGFVGQRQLG